MLRPSLRYLFPASLFVVGCVVLVTLASRDLWRSYRDVETQMLRQSTVLGIVLSAGLESAFRRGTRSEAREVFRRASNDRTLEMALLVDERGQIIFTSDFSYRGTELADTPLAFAAAEVQTVVRTRSTVTTVSKDGDSVIGVFPVALQTSPLSLVSSRTGALVLTHRLAQQKQAALQRSAGYVAILALLLLALAAVAWKLFDRLLMHRVRALLAFTDQADGARHLDLEGDDEIARISRAVARMADRLLEQNRALETSRGFLTAALDAVPANIAVLDSAGRIVSVNEAWKRFEDANDFGFPDYGVGMHYIDTCAAASVASDASATQIADALGEVLNGERRGATFDYTCQTRGGDRAFSLQIQRFDYGGERLALTSHVDVTEARQAAAEIAAAEQRYRTLYNENPAMFFTIDRFQRIASVNDFGAEQLGYAVPELLGTDAASLYDPTSRSDFQRYAELCFANPGQVQRWEATKRRRDGSTFRVRETGRLALEPDGSGAMLVVCEDISEAHELSKELRQLATTDGLTGLINRYEFERRLAHLIQSAKIDDSEHVLAYIDLDQFKIINDTSGHVAGDELLRQIGQIIRQRVRNQDTLARLGGDEFGVIMEHCSIDKGREVAEALCASAEDFRFVWEDRAFIIGTSIGIARINAETVDVTEVMRAADAACYAAKDAGRNRVRVYELDDIELSRRHGEMQWLSSVQQAMDESRIELYTQQITPCVDAEDNLAAMHYEVLIRMHGTDGELYSPGAFLPAAERYGLAPRLDRWVIEHCFGWLSDHPAHLAKLSLCAINLSGHTLADPQFVAFVQSAVAAGHIPTRKICFEITETAAIANIGVAIQCIEGLRRLGCWVALDDFGTGMSSFAYLKSLPVDFLKIDGVFIKDIASDPVGEAMVRSINEIGHLLGKKTIAEFVESEAILTKLGEIGVDFAQGYAIGRPHPMTELGGSATSADQDDTPRHTGRPR